MVIYTLCCATVCTEMSLDIIHNFLVHGHTFLQTDRHCGLTETEAGKSDLAKHARVNPLNAELNPTCHLLVLLGAHHILHVSRIRVKLVKYLFYFVRLCSTRIGMSVCLCIARSNKNKWKTENT